VRLIHPHPSLLPPPSLILPPSADALGNQNTNHHSLTCRITQARLSIENLNRIGKNTFFCFLGQICSAIKAADAHDRILIAKGVYNEALLVDKAIELVGAPPPAPTSRNPEI
jgi:hypothetical protein